MAATRERLKYEVKPNKTVGKRKKNALRLTYAIALYLSSERVLVILDWNFKNVERDHWRTKSRYWYVLK
jgi:hypothetical protein